MHMGHNHGGMDHGDMDMGGQCNMNVRYSSASGVVYSWDPANIFYLLDAVQLVL
jgi:hypothetical protein